MRLNKIVWATAAILLAAVLTSCNIGKAPEPTVDANAIYTSAAETMVADLGSQQTQTAQAVPPTAQASPTALATITPLATFAVGTGVIPFGTPLGFGTLTSTTPGVSITATLLPAGTNSVSFPVGCDNATYLGETPPDDGTRIEGGKKFDKGWSFLNSGTCTWDVGYSFAFKDGDQLQGENIRISQDSDKTKPGAGQAFNVQFQAPVGAGEYKGRWQMKNASGVWFGSIVWVDIVVK
ncbi:MAG TPA: NBR1-Ig-like domain-containing protein [Anaerolineales bacterium]|nr:NBR1-Ig-like domain-containing protein [Anaerolineales bacterium]